MTSNMMLGGPPSRLRLFQALSAMNDTKQTQPELMYGMLGRFDDTGAKITTVVGYPDRSWVRVNGRDSELIQALNDQMGLQWSDPVILIRDSLQPRWYRILGRDTARYPDWGGNPLLPRHGDQHSFADASAAGRDIVWIYRRQMVQPLLCHPTSPATMFVQVEPDFYFWNNAFTYFAGGLSSDLTAYLPSNDDALFVTIYLDGTTNLVAELAGTTFSNLAPPTNLVSYIPEIAPDVGIPLAAVYLTSATVSCGWDVLTDVRIMISPGGIIGVSSSAVQEELMFWYGG